MKKIKTVFERNRIPGKNVKVHDVGGHTNWVIEGKGFATRKWDGRAVLVQNNEIFVRYDCKAGRKAPDNFLPCEESPDPITGHWPGWVPLQATDRPIVESVAWWKQNRGHLPDGTYEAVGPKIGTRHGANPENLTEQILVRHGEDILDVPDRSFNGIKEFLRDKNIEGIVFYYNGEMMKIKKIDFAY